jgi:8-oxo-dGTP pyrophosphatase MutT (NUDIX family)
MQNSKFKNRPNEATTTADGRQIWLSRSVAVVSQVVIQTPYGLTTLIAKRGPASMGSIGKWCFPCGYLDYNETVEEAAIRETYEETGVDLNEMMNSTNYLHYYRDIHRQPWNVDSAPSKERQNVSLSHCFYFTTNTDPIVLPKTSKEFCEPGETDDIQWVNLCDVAEGKFDMAFNHDNLASKLLHIL